MPVVLALLLSLACAGIAHASRLCGTSGHPDWAPAKPSSCHEADARPHRAGDGSAPLTDQRAPSCCRSELGLVAIPAPRVQASGDAVPLGAAAAHLDAPATLGSVMHVLLRPCSARDPGSGPRRHLVQRVLLI